MNWGYAIMVSRFTLLFLDSGIAKSFGVLIPMMVEHLDSDYATVGFICSMPASLVYLCFPLIKLILVRFDTRCVAMSGGVLSAVGILACGFSQNTTVLGVCLALSGIGFSMALMPSTIKLNQFFPADTFVLMNSITLYGYTAGSTVLPVITERSVQAYGYYGAFIILAGISLNIAACGATYREALPSAENHKPLGTNHEDRHSVNRKTTQGTKREDTSHGNLEAPVNENGNKPEESLSRDALQTRKHRALQTINRDVPASEGRTKEQMLQQRLLDKYDGEQWPAQPNSSQQLFREKLFIHGVEGNNTTSVYGYTSKEQSDQYSTGERGFLRNKFGLSRKVDNASNVVDAEEQQKLIQDTELHNDASCIPDLLQNPPRKTPSMVSPLRSHLQSFEILQERFFLFSIPVHFLIAYVIYAWMFFLVPHAEHLGIPASRAVFLSTIGGVGGVFGRTLFNVLLGKGVQALAIYIPVCVICTLSFFLDFISSAYLARALLAFCQGFCFFIEDTVMITLSKTLIVNEKNFDTAYTIGGFLAGAGVTVSGLFTGFLFDTIQSFTKVFILVGLVHGLVVVNLTLLVIILKKWK